MLPHCVSTVRRFAKGHHTTVVRARPRRTHYGTLKPLAPTRSWQAARREAEAGARPRTASLADTCRSEPRPRSLLVVAGKGQSRHNSPEPLIATGLSAVWREQTPLGTAPIRKPQTCLGGRLREDTLQLLTG